MSQAEGASIEILLEAHDENGRIIGEPKQNTDNNVTKVINLLSGEKRKIPIRMIEDKDGSVYEGNAIIKAINPNNMIVFNEINLETDYVI